jgi:hypothetical protein
VNDARIRIGEKSSGPGTREDTSFVIAGAVTLAAIAGGIVIQPSWTKRAGGGKEARQKGRGPKPVRTRAGW